MRCHLARPRRILAFSARVAGSFAPVDNASGKDQRWAGRNAGEALRPALWRSQEAAMSHAALVNVGLFYIVVIQPLLLVMFVQAVRRAPSGPADSADHPVPEPPAPEASASGQAEPVRLPARVPWPSADALGSPSETGYVGRHGTRGGPPWGPAPKPPGAAW